MYIGVGFLLGFFVLFFFHAFYLWGQATKTPKGPVLAVVTGPGKGNLWLENNLKSHYFFLSIWASHKNKQKLQDCSILALVSKILVI